MDSLETRLDHLTMSTKINRSDDEDVSERLELLGDACARSILAAARTEPRTAKELTASTESSAATVYRRVNSLLESGLLVETVRFDEEGKHTTAYETRIEEVLIAITGSGFDIAVSETE